MISGGRISPVQDTPVGKLDHVIEEVGADAPARIICEGIEVAVGDRELGHGSRRNILVVPLDGTALSSRINVDANEATHKIGFTVNGTVVADSLTWGSMHIRIHSGRVWNIPSAKREGMGINKVACMQELLGLQVI